MNFNTYIVMKISIVNIISIVGKVKTQAYAETISTALVISIKKRKKVIVI